MTGGTNLDDEDEGDDDDDDNSNSRPKKRKSQTQAWSDFLDRSMESKDKRAQLESRRLELEEKRICAEIKRAEAAQTMDHKEREARLEREKTNQELQLEMLRMMKSMREK